MFIIYHKNTAHFGHIKYSNNNDNKIQLITKKRLFSSPIIHMLLNDSGMVLQHYKGKNFNISYFGCLWHAV